METITVTAHGGLAELDRQVGAAAVLVDELLSVQAAAVQYRRHPGAEPMRRHLAKMIEQYRLSRVRLLHEYLEAVGLRWCTIDRHTQPIHLVQPMLLEERLALFQDGIGQPLNPALNTPPDATTLHQVCGYCEPRLYQEMRGGSHMTAYVIDYRDNGPWARRLDETEYRPALQYVAGATMAADHVVITPQLAAAYRLPAAIKLESD